MTTLSHIWQKFLEILHYPAGWLLGLCLFVSDAFAGGAMIVYIVVVASVIDLACGIAVSKKKGDFTLSELIRQTAEKFLVYGPVLLAFLCLDKLIQAETTIELSLSSALVGAVISMAEVWSFSASLLILFPKNAFLRLLQKSLTGEIARKLGCTNEEVEEILKQYRGRRKPARNAKGQFVSKKDSAKSKKK